MERRSLVFTGRESTAIRDTTVDHGPAELLVETQVSAISPGTELLIYRGEAPRDLPADETLDALEGDLSYPLRYGYAAVGEVVDVGQEADEEWLGRTVMAFNPHETAFSASPDAVVPIPEALEPEALALYPTVETASSLVLDGRPRVDERVVVFGAGVVGLSTTALLSRFPLSDLVVVDPIASRRELALELGADAVATPERLSISRWDDAPGPAGADLIYELSGQPAALDDAVGIAGYDSRVLVGSWYGTKSATLDLGGDFHRDRVTIESSQVSTIDPDHRGRYSFDRRTEMALDALETFPVDSLITHHVPFEEAPRAYRLLNERPEDALQVLLTY